MGSSAATSSSNVGGKLFVPPKGFLAVDEVGSCSEPVSLEGFFLDSRLGGSRLEFGLGLLLIASLVNNVLVSVVGGALRSIGVVGSESGEEGREETEDLCEVADGGVA